METGGCFELEAEDAGRNRGFGEGARRRQRVSGVDGGSSAPAEMRRSGDAASCAGRCGRISVCRLSGVVVAGEDIARGRSSIGGEKRIIKESGFVMSLSLRGNEGEDVRSGVAEICLLVLF